MNARYIIFTPSDFTNTLIFALKSLISSQVVCFSIPIKSMESMYGIFICYFLFGTWNTHFRMVVWWNNHFPRKGLQSSHWKRTRWMVVDALLSFFLPKKNPPGWLLEVLDIGPDVQIWACLHLSRQTCRTSWGAKEFLGIQALLGGENGSDPKQS